MGDCLHPEADRGICDKAIAAHTIQRAGPIAQIRDAGNHVRSFHPLERDNTGEAIVNRIGWRDASTFPGFCADHDNSTFAPLEQNEFTGSSEQCFLAAYRTLCFELHCKRAAFRFSSELKKQVSSSPETFSSQAPDYIRWREGGDAAGLRDMSAYKACADRALIDGDRSEWLTRILSFDGPCNVATAGCFFPDFDLDGRQLQNLYNLEDTPEPLIVTTVTTSRGGAVCFTFLRNAVAPVEFLRSLESRPRERIASTVVQLLFGYFENTFFDWDWWGRLRPMQQAHIRRLAGTTQTYGRPIPLIASRLIHWENLSFRWSAV